jgi:hypothetical protein
LKKAEIGIIGGSGLYAMPGLTNVREERVSTRRTLLYWVNLKAARLRFLRAMGADIVCCRLS